MWKSLASRYSMSVSEVTDNDRVGSEHGFIGQYILQMIILIGNNGKLKLIIVFHNGSLQSFQESGKQMDPVIGYPVERYICFCGETAPQYFGLDIRLIAHFSGCFQDPLLCFFLDLAPVPVSLQNDGDGAGRKPQAGGDILNGSHIFLHSEVFTVFDAPPYNGHSRTAQQFRRAFNGINYTINEIHKKCKLMHKLMRNNAMVKNLIRYRRF